MGLFDRNKNVTTGKDGNLYFGKGTEGGRAPDVNKIKKLSQRNADIAALIEEETEAAEKLEHIRLQKQAILDEMYAEQKLVEDEIDASIKKLETLKAETAQQLRQDSVQGLTLKPLNPNDNPYRVALLQLVDGEMKKVYCDRPDWRACPQHGSASPFLTKSDGTRYIPEYLKPAGAKTPKEQTLATIHNNFPDWVGDYLQPLNDNDRTWYRNRHEPWDEGKPEFGMIHSNIQSATGLPTYLKICGKLRDDVRFDVPIETDVKIDANGNAKLYTFYASPHNVRRHGARGMASGMFEVTTPIPYSKINKEDMAEYIKEHYDTVLNKTKQLNNIVRTAYRDGKEVDVTVENTTYDPNNPEHQKIRPSRWEEQN